MTKISVKNLNGEKVKDLTLNDSIFKIEVNDDALKKMIRLQLDATRQGTRKTKNRSEVSGGGRKPWKQKGTGRARLNGLVAEYHLVLVTVTLVSKLIRKKEYLH